MIIASARHIKSRRNTSTAHGPSRASVEGVSATRVQSKPYNPQAASAVARAPPHRVAPARSKAAQLSRVQWLPAESHPTFQNYIAHKADWRHLSSVPGLTAARGLGTHRRTAASDPCAEALRCQADRTRLKQRYPPSSSLRSGVVASAPPPQPHQCTVANEPPDARRRKAKPPSIMHFALASFKISQIGLPKHWLMLHSWKVGPYCRKGLRNAQAHCCQRSVR